MQTYQMPDVGGVKVPNLLPSTQNAEQLTAETKVRCINRCNRPLVDKYNSQEYTIPVGYFDAQYQQARLFQQHQVVPGSKDPQSGNMQSWIGIIGIDPPELCEPFSFEEVASAEQQPEAIAAPAGRRVVNTADVLRALPGMGGSTDRRTIADLSVQATPEAADAASDVLQPVAPHENYALREMQQDAAEGADVAEVAAQAGPRMTPTRRQR